MRLLLCAAVTAQFADVTQFEDGDPVEIKVNKFNSVVTQIPFGFYDVFPECNPDFRFKADALNLGEILMGDRIFGSNITVNMSQDIHGCRLFCQVSEVDQGLMDWLQYLTEKRYRFSLFGDDLPAVSILHEKQLDVEVGITKNSKPFIFNHFQIHLHFHRARGTNLKRVVGFQILPSYRDPEAPFENELRSDGDFCKTTSVPQETKVNEDLTFTYEVIWSEDEKTEYMSRFDVNILFQKEPVRWRPILNSIIICLGMALVVALIFLRTLLRSISLYNELATREDALEETGWKLVHGDVFRKPNRARLLAAFIGSGVHLTFVLGLSLIFMFLGIWSFQKRGSMLSKLIILYAFSSSIAGYFSARVYKVFSREHWKSTTLLTATLFPSFLSLLAVVVNLFLIRAKTSLSGNFSAILKIFGLWFGVSLPLVFCGSFVGYRRESIELPVRTNEIPRQIPGNEGLRFAILPCIFGGIFPFAAMFTQLLAVMQSLFLHQYIQLFGCLLISFVLFVILCGMCSMIMTYFQLQGENYHWWWRSFFVAGTSGVYTFFYSLVKFDWSVDETPTAVIVLAAILTVSFAVFLVAGSSGVLTSFWFVRKIYGSIKVD